ncbi:kokopelli [Tasmannia lanceolata]|uniref:kokopelli n=1 Tax=Tasmannia lanceolata TaxID=3420 RepID=UPI004064B1EC
MDLEDERQLDEKSRLLLKKLLDAATEQAFQCPIKIIGEQSNPSILPHYTQLGNFQTVSKSQPSDDIVNEIRRSDNDSKFHQITMQKGESSNQQRSPRILEKKPKITMESEKEGRDSGKPRRRKVHEIHRNLSIEKSLLDSKNSSTMCCGTDCGSLELSHKFSDEPTIRRTDGQIAVGQVRSPAEAKTRKCNLPHQMLNQQVVLTREVVTGHSGKRGMSQISDIRGGPAESTRTSQERNEPVRMMSRKQSRTRKMADQMMSQNSKDARERPEMSRMATIERVVVTQNESKNRMEDPLVPQLKKDMASQTSGLSETADPSPSQTTKPIVAKNQLPSQGGAKIGKTGQPGSVLSQTLERNIEKKPTTQTDGEMMNQTVGPSLKKESTNQHKPKLTETPHKRDQVGPHEGRPIDPFRENRTPTIEPTVVTSVGAAGDRWAHQQSKKKMEDVLVPHQKKDRANQKGGPSEMTDQIPSQSTKPSVAKNQLPSQGGKIIKSTMPSQTLSQTLEKNVEKKPTNQMDGKMMTLAVVPTPKKDPTNQSRARMRETLQRKVRVGQHDDGPSPPSHSKRSVMLTHQLDRFQKKNRSLEKMTKQKPYQTKHQFIQETSETDSSLSRTTHSDSTSYPQTCSSSESEDVPRRMLTHSTVGPTLTPKDKSLPRRMLTHHVGTASETRTAPLPRRKSLHRQKTLSHHIVMDPRPHHVEPTNRTSKSVDRHHPIKEGRLRRFKNKLGIIFHHHHHHHIHGRDPTSSDDNQHHPHRRSLWNSLQQNFHHTSKEPHTKPISMAHKDRSTVKNSPHRHLHALLDGFLAHVWHSKATESDRARSAAGRRRVKKKKQLHWWQKFRKLGGVKLANPRSPRLMLRYRRTQKTSHG